MRCQELPENPRIWTDFVRSRLQFLQPFPTLQDLLERRKGLKARPAQGAGLLPFPAAGKGQDSAPVLKNIQRLGRPETVAVVTNFYAGLFGGAVYQVLKCLAAIRICEELEKQGVEAVPVCWFSPQPPPGCPPKP